MIHPKIVHNLDLHRFKPF